MGKAQREYFLREQLKAIQRELGELDGDQAELSELRERIKKAGLPPEALREADRELGRLERIPSASPESSVIRTYLDLMVSLPWNMSTEGELDVARAREVLDADHYDLDKVKKRIVEHLAVRRLKQERGSTDRGREPRLPRQLPGRSVRPLARDVHHHREHAGHRAVCAQGPRRGAPALGLHRGGEGPDRAPLPAAQAAGGSRAARPRGGAAGGAD